MQDDAPRRQVMGQSASGGPGAAGAQHVANGVDDLPSGVGDRPTTRFGGRQQGFKQLPFSVAEIAGISWSFHTTTLQPTPMALPSCVHPNWILFRHPLSEFRMAVQPRLD